MMSRSLLFLLCLDSVQIGVQNVVRHNLVSEAY